MPIGQQAPRFRIEPSGLGTTDGPDAAELIAGYSFEMDEWQRLVLDAWLARDEYDRFLYTTCGLAVPRQNGKNAALEARELYGMLCNGEKILHTSHLVRTSKKAFRHLADIFVGGENPELAEQVVELRRTNGEEMIRLSNGGQIEYSARSRGSARGWTVDVVVFDEAQELTDDQIEAILPTMSAAPTGNRQMIYTGTPPGPNSPGDVFRRVRKASLENPSERSCWHEWSVDAIGDVTDVSRWYETNPALGTRLTEEFCTEELRTMSEDGFARERLGWWSEQSVHLALPSAVWQGAATSEPMTEGKKGFAVKFSPDGSQVALVAVRYDGEKSYCELVGLHPLNHGIQWLTNSLCSSAMKKTTACICVDGKNGAGALVSELRKTYPDKAIVTPRVRDITTATAMTVEGLRGGTVTHWADPGQAELDLSAATSVKRKIGTDGAWAFGGDESAPMEALCLANWAIRTTKRTPGKGAKLL